MNTAPENVVALTPENFQQVLLEVSNEKAVVVSFWMEAHEQSKEATNLVSAIAAEYPDELLVATVDCEAQQAIAMQFGVRALPTVAVIKNGQPVDGLGGEVDEPKLREMLAKHLPLPEDKLVKQAAALIAEQQADEAYAKAKQAFELNNERADIKLVLADAALDVGKSDEAEQLLGTVMMADQDSYYHSLMSKLELAKEAAESPEIKALQQQIAESPDDLELKVQLGVKFNEANMKAEALDVLFDVLKKDMNFGEAKKLFLGVISNLPAGDTLATSYRQKLYSMMY